MLGRKKKDKATEEKTAAVPEKSYFDIGKNGTVEEFCEANQKTLSIRSQYGHLDGGNEQGKLQEGAIEAFQEGDVENLQTILANTSEFKKYYAYKEPIEVDCEQILSQLIKLSAHQSAVIKLALGKVPEEEKQKYLDGVLLRSVWDHYYGDDLVVALLSAGADANANFDGKGYTLAKAIENSQPLSVIKLLHDNGASFKDALFLMQIKKWEDKDINSLKTYREEITGEPAVDNADIREVLKEMKEMKKQLLELTKRIDGKLQVSAPAARKPKTAQPAAPQ